MAKTPDKSGPTPPIPIFRLGSKTERYMLYDVETITWLRREHHILGVLVGTLPQVPQQNIFLGIPLELMPEEARLLIEKGIAYIVRDTDRHQAWREISKASDQEAYRKLVRLQASGAFRISEEKKAAGKASAAKIISTRKSKVADQGDSSVEDPPGASREPPSSLFEVEDTQTKPTKDSDSTRDEGAKAWGSTPVTSFPLLPTPDATGNKELNKVKESSFALFKYLHANGYFLSPGLRFGCQFMAYPGDPLRYHSHFLVVSADWDEEIDLLGVIGEGRLATGVKKSFLLGGAQQQPDGSTTTRAFCLEWGVM